MRVIVGHNDEAKPFAWTYSGELRNTQRIADVRRREEPRGSFGRNLYSLGVSDSPRTPDPEGLVSPVGTRRDLSVASGPVPRLPPSRQPHHTIHLRVPTRVEAGRPSSPDREQIERIEQHDAGHSQLHRISETPRTGPVWSRWNTPL